MTWDMCSDTGDLVTSHTCTDQSPGHTHHSRKCSRHSRKLKHNIFARSFNIFYHFLLGFMHIFWLTDAVWEVVVARGALVAECAAVVLSTRALEVAARLVLGHADWEPGVLVL